MLERPDIAPPETSGVCSVVQQLMLLAYSDFAHEKMGRRFFQSLVATGMVGNHTAVTEWKFEMFDSSALNQMAAVDAAKAAIVIISMNGKENLPESFRHWFESWCTPFRQANAAKVVLVLSEVRKEQKLPFPDFSYMQTQTEASGAEFLVYASPFPPEQSNLFYLRETQSSSTGAPAAMSLPDIIAFHPSLISVSG